MKLRITRITIQGDTFRIHLENGETLTLPLAIEYTGKYGRDDLIDDATLDSLRRISGRFKCREAALSYISRSMKSERMVREYLHKKGFGSDDTDKVMEELEKRELVNDRLYAREYLLSLLRRKIVGRKYAEHRLLQKGIASALVREVLDDQAALFDSEDDLFSLACERYRRLEGKPKQYERLASFLERRGFPPGRIIQTLNKMKEEGYTFND